MTQSGTHFYFVKSLALLAFLSLSLCAQAEVAPAPGVERPPNERICFALYTVHDKRLKLTAQFYPLKDFEPFTASLQVRSADADSTTAWKTVAESEIFYPGYTANFRVEDWDDSRAHQYRVVHNNTAFYRGTIQKNPLDQDTFVMAAMSCNSTRTSDGGDLSRNDIVENLQKIKPDLIFFAGDQVYDHSEHLRFWLKFGRDFGAVLRNTPTVCLPDDHDVGQANLWGEAGKKCPSRDGMLGGYYMPAEYVKEVERAQTSHLPDPYDPTPVEQGIGVYYTHLNWGGVSFAILEDRKFKSAPYRFNKLPGRADSITTPGYKPRDLDGEDSVLLGQRQLKFLEDWTTDWQQAQMKCVLSQTIFAQTCNYSGKHEKELLADFDANGWPQSGRNRALAVIRKSSACMVAGDQHLATIVKHGINDWGDAGYSFATPAVANYWLRWWDPKQPGKNRPAGAPPYCGDFHDGFGNKMTVLAVANPSVEERQADGSKLSTRAAGIGIVKFDKSARTTTFECWPRNVDITGPASGQYPGWPVTIKQQEDSTFVNGYDLPLLKISDANQVVTISNSGSGELVSSRRIQGTAFQPRVPRRGSYTITVGEGARRVTLRDVEAGQPSPQPLTIDLALASE